MITTKYSNPFEPEGNQKLIHLSSGVERRADDITKSMLSLPSLGQELHEEFRKTRLLSTSVSSITSYQESSACHSVTPSLENKNNKETQGR